MSPLLAYYHNLSMMSSKWGYLHTHIIEKVEEDKMANKSDREYSDEEDGIVAAVGGRARRIVEAVRRIKREREQGGPFQI